MVTRQKQKQSKVVGKGTGQRHLKKQKWEPKNKKKRGRLGRRKRKIKVLGAAETESKMVHDGCVDDDAFMPERLFVARLGGTDRVKLDWSLLPISTRTTGCLRYTVTVLDAQTGQFISCHHALQLDANSQRLVNLRSMIT